MLTLILLALFASITPGSGRGVQAPPPPQPPVQPRMPARDAITPAQKGTASIKGRVVSADAARPLRRAQIRVFAQELSEARTTSTNTQGLFEIRDLPAGRYTVRVTRSGYLPLDYGQRHPGEPGRPLQIGEGEKVEKVEFALPRAGVISGQIVDETADAVAGVSVYAMQPQYFRGRRRLVPVGSFARTDDTGQYRLLAVPPGDYIVMATLRETWSTRGEQKQVLGYAPSYFPGTANAPDAQRVKVAVGQEVSAVDFSLVPGRAATVSGTAMRADGTPLAGGSVSLSQEVIGPSASSFSSAGGTKIAADGTWTMKDVSPGEYRLSASGPSSGSGTEELSMTIAVHGTDLDLALVTGAPGTLTGHVVTDDGAPLPASPTKLRVVAESTVVDRRSSGVSSEDPNGLVGSDGTFTFKGLTGPAILKISWLPKGWSVKSVEVGGRDYTLAPLEVPAGQTMAGARIVTTKKFPAVSGRITDARGEPAEGTVVFFPADGVQWAEAAGSVIHARPDQSGTFRFESVRPGEYLVAALEYVQTWQLADPEFLEGLRRDATKVVVQEGENEPIAVKLKKGT
jgi:hypothetical protein